MKKKWKKLDNLLNKYHYTSLSPEDEYVKDHNPWVVEIYRLFDELGMSKEEGKLYWHNKTMDKRRRSAEYRRKPIKVHKDNPNLYGETMGCSWRNIRVPKKGRKTAWKRFYKLFPERAPNFTPPTVVKEKVEEDEYTIMKKVHRRIMEGSEDDLYKMPHINLVAYLFSNSFIEERERDRICSMLDSPDKEMVNLGTAILVRRVMECRKWRRNKRKLRTPK